MKLLRKRDIPEERYTNAFLGYGPEDSHFVVELTYSKLLLPRYLHHISVVQIMCTVYYDQHIEPLWYLFWQIMVWRAMTSGLVSAISGLLLTM
jgi:hypothetical protein